MTINLNQLQKEIETWADKTFGSRSENDKIDDIKIEFGILFGEALEEIVPLLHAFRQSSKLNTLPSNDDSIKYIVGNIMIHLLDYCSLRGWDSEGIIKNTWEIMRNKEWDHDPFNRLSKPKN